MKNQETLQSKLDNILLNQEKDIVLLISSSRNELDIAAGSFIGGIRKTDRFCIVSIISQSQEEIRDIIRNTFKRVYMYFVEAEKKLPFNYSKIDSNKYIRCKESDFSNLYQSALEELISFDMQEKILKWKPGDLTVLSALNYVREWEKSSRPRIISIIGLGSIGSKLALSLVEEGFHIKTYNRRTHKGDLIASALNKLISKHTIAKIVNYESLEPCVAESDILINCASSTKFLNPKLFSLMRDPSFFLDIGKNSLIDSNDSFACMRSKSCYRCDISIEVEKFVTSQLISNKFTLPREFINNDGKRYIEPGLLATPGDIVVRDINKLSTIIGKIDKNLRLIHD